MAHPFFDASVYPWHRPEAVILHKALTQAIQNNARIDLLYKQSANNLLPLALGQAPDVIWKEVLENLARAPGGLQKLCDAILGDNTLTSYHNAARDVINALPAVEMRIISDNILILDRVTLREKIALLEPDAAQVKALLVRGSPRSGKSYSRYLFEGTARDMGAVPVYLCDGIVATVDEVIRELFSALGASKKIPPRLTTEDAWYSAVCSKLQEIALDKKQRLWIAVDDLGPAQDGAPLLDTEIRKFFDQFALKLLNPAFGQWFRLMLIHYPDGPVPTKWKREIWAEDRTSDADVVQEHIAEVLRSWSVAHDRKLIENELTGLAGDVVAKADDPLAQGQEPAPRLQRIHDALAETLRDLARR